MQKIISGGQVSVDRAALDVALALGLSVGGWCPKDRRAEDGRIPDRYPLTETPEADYDTRTRRNVLEVSFPQRVAAGDSARPALPRETPRSTNKTG